ncbi:hypothetical protein DIPPA_03961 [Diplonema papillatum]|nr:hypothetical protein DIPPA_03961 [Diplonema papillatum]
MSVPPIFNFASYPFGVPKANVFGIPIDMPVFAQNLSTSTKASCKHASLRRVRRVRSSAKDSLVTPPTSSTLRTTMDSSALMRITLRGQPCSIPLVV